LLGPNGAGKTTTVEILEGYRGRDGGEVSVLGTDPRRAGRAWRAPGFDPAARRAFWAVVRSLSGSGVTVLLTTHPLDEAAALADRVAVLCEGVIVASGRPAELGGRPTAQAGASTCGRLAARSLRVALTIGQHMPTVSASGVCFIGSSASSHQVRIGLNVSWMRIRSLAGDYFQRSADPQMILPVHSLTARCAARIVRRSTEA